MKLRRLITHKQSYYSLLTTLDFSVDADMTDKNRDAIGIASAKTGNVKAIWGMLYGQVHEQLTLAYLRATELPESDEANDLAENLSSLLRAIEGYKEG